MQLHFRLLSSGERVLLVLISRVRIAESRAERVVEEPCMDCPPVMWTFVFCLVAAGRGEEVREGFWEDEEDFVLKSDIRVPEAEGGAFGVGAWMAAGLGLRENALLGVGVGDGRLDM